VAASHDTGTSLAFTSMPPMRCAGPASRSATRSMRHFEPRVLSCNLGSPQASLASAHPLLPDLTEDVDVTRSVRNLAAGAWRGIYVRPQCLGLVLPGFIQPSPLRA